MAVRASRLVSLVVALAASGSLTLGSGVVPSAHAQGLAATETEADGQAPSRAVNKLLVVIEENHSLSQMRVGMPYANSLAQRFGYATNYHAITHPSLPDYLAIVSGTTHGVTDDDPPSSHRVRGRTVFGQALARGHSAAVYGDGMRSPCATTSTGRPPYAVGHNPWPYFVGERRACRTHDLPGSRLWSAIRSGRLPNAGLVVPDKCHDAHDCSLATADAWFRHLTTAVFRGRDWRSGHLAVVLTADEDDGSSGNGVLTVVIHPSQHHHVVTTALNHYSLTKLYAQVAHTTYLGHARAAPSMARAFALPLR
jgi:acid phosphatase